MGKALTTFGLVAILTGLLAAASFALARNGYPFGSLGLARLEGLASSATFIPLAAIYFLAAALLMILPLRAASFVLVNGAEKLFYAVTVLFATIVGLLCVRAAFGDMRALWALWDWQFIFGAAVAATHLLLDEIRRNVLLRSLFVILFVAASLACLFWSFKL
jgi:hypothetical protein